jgi:S1-C subfamily serine protease
MVQRRLLLDGVAQAGDRGAPVWAKDGTLLGLLDAAPGEPLAVVPVTGIPSAFSSLVSDGAIRTATLGVQATDLTGVVRAAPSSGPVVGAWIHEGRKGAVPAVAKDGPAKNLLKAGDTVLAIDRDILDGTRDLGDILSEYRPGAKVTVRVSRDGADLDVPVVLGGATVGEAVR